MKTNERTLATLNETAEFLRRRQGFLILTHRRPDGDTAGSAAALCRLLRRLGKTAWMQANEDLTEKYRFLYDGLIAPAEFQPETVVAADVADENLLPESAQIWRGNVDLCIDHHPSNQGYARLTLLDAGCAATGELVWRLALLLEAPADLAFCQGIYTAVATDTGCFRYANTTAQSHRAAAYCMEQGLDCQAVNQAFFETKTRARFQAERLLFERLIFSAQGKIAVALLTQREIQAIGAGPDDLDNLAALPRQVEGVSCAVVLIETGEDQYKASVRSDGGLDASARCARFGGGGHSRAAGCTLKGPGEDCLARVTAAAQEALGYV